MPLDQTSPQLQTAMTKLIQKNYPGTRKGQIGGALGTWEMVGIVSGALVVLILIWWVIRRLTRGPGAPSEVVQGPASGAPVYDKVPSSPSNVVYSELPPDPAIAQSTWNWIEPISNTQISKLLGKFKAYPAYMPQFINRARAEDQLIKSNRKWLIRWADDVHHTKDQSVWFVISYPTPKGFQHSPVLSNGQFVTFGDGDKWGDLPSLLKNHPFFSSLVQL